MFLEYSKFKRNKAGLESNWGTLEMQPPVKHHQTLDIKGPQMCQDFCKHIVSICSILVNSQLFVKL